ncbi:MAG: hypothetical protein JNL62_29000 [Bryobacterales bacterium]|nr:hypothetical protein [Bryobacterales bacterium]
MLDSRTKYTATVAFLLMGFIASPVVLFASRSLDYTSVSLAIAFSALCSGMAWNQWKRHTEVAVPSITKRPLVVK